MNVTCPNCATIYRVDPAKVPEAGVRARCAVCNAVFAVRRESEAARIDAPIHPAATAAQPQTSARAEPLKVDAPRAEPVKTESPRPEPPKPAPASPEPLP